jgi:hypothetical protein
MPFVSVTRLRVRAWRYLPLFLLGSVHAVLQARRTLGKSVLRDAHLAFWTRTVWSGEAAMRGFMLSGTHRRLMHRLLEWCDEAAVVNWTTDVAPPPAWSEAHRRLQVEGRPSKVKHPSDAQRRFEIPPPRV